MLVAVIGGVAVMSSANRATPAAHEPAANTVKVTRGKLADMVSQDGTLTYRARSDGSPYAVVNHARGTYTKLPTDGARVDCGDVLYRVDDHPVLLLCGTVPAYRDLRLGDKGKDVRQLNRDLHKGGNDFTEKTEKALEKLQHKKGLDVTGSLAVDDAVSCPTRCGPPR